MNHFTLYTVTNVITEESSERGDYASSDASETEEVSLREAVDALLGGCWDNIDLSGNAVIAYPADYEQSMTTGDYSADELIINADSPRNAERLLDAYEAAAKARQARIDARSYIYRGIE